MAYRLPNDTRQLFLDDVIETEKTGISPIRQNQKLARQYLFSRNLTRLSLLAVGTSLYFSLTKLHTYRQVYLLSLFTSLGLGYLFNHRTSGLKMNCLKQFNCSDDQFKDYVEFYRYVALDHMNYYEQTK